MTFLALLTVVWSRHIGAECIHTQCRALADDLLVVTECEGQTDDAELFQDHAHAVSETLRFLECMGAR
eukprot:10938547-Alexandrium_andersonii.AAC.1